MASPRGCSLPASAAAALFEVRDLALRYGSRTALDLPALVLREGERLEDFRGLAKRRPALAFAITNFVLLPTLQKGLGIPGPEVAAKSKLDR